MRSIPIVLLKVDLGMPPAQFFDHVTFYGEIGDRYHVTILVTEPLKGDPQLPRAGVEV